MDIDPEATRDTSVKQEDTHLGSKDPYESNVVSAPANSSACESEADPESASSSLAQSDGLLRQTPKSSFG